MKAKKLPLRQLLMDMAGKAKAGLQGPAGFLSEARLEAYLGKLDPARGVSRVRLEAYQTRLEAYLELSPQGRSVKMKIILSSTSVLYKQNLSFRADR